MSDQYKKVANTLESVFSREKQLHFGCTDRLRCRHKGLGTFLCEGRTPERAGSVPSSASAQQLLGGFTQCLYLLQLEKSYSTRSKPWQVFHAGNGAHARCPSPAKPVRHSSCVTHSPYNPFRRAQPLCNRANPLGFTSPAKGHLPDPARTRLRNSLASCSHSFTQLNRSLQGRVTLRRFYFKTRPDFSHLSSKPHPRRHQEAGAQARCLGCLLPLHGLLPHSSSSCN